MTRAWLAAAFVVAGGWALPQSTHGAGEGWPRFWYDSTTPSGVADPRHLLNDNESPRIRDTAAYWRFFREHGAVLHAWAADRRLNLNPSFVAALIAKESGFEPFATSHVPANGIGQMTHVADADLVIITRHAPAFQWMGPEVSAWPRAPAVHTAAATKARTDSLVAAGQLTGANEYFFAPRTALRGTMFWLRILADIWQLDEWPGMYGSLIRARLGTADGMWVSESDLLALVTVSYNQGHPYVAALVRRHGRDWTRHLNDEARDYLDRVQRYTEIFQRAGAPRPIH